MHFCSRLRRPASLRCVLHAAGRVHYSIGLAVVLAAACLMTMAGFADAQQSVSASGPPAPPVALSALAPGNLGSEIDLLLSSPAASRAHWGISVVDVATGKPLYVRNEGQLFEPASNAKLYTTAAALALLGPSFTMQTRVAAEGTLTPDGELHGSLRLVGGGDPTLSGRSYPYMAQTERPDPPLHALDDLAAQVAAAGIRAVDGPIIGDDTLFVYERYGTGWAWDDLQWDYGAPVSALTVADNVEYLTVTPGATPGAPIAAFWMNQPNPRAPALTVSSTAQATPVQPVIDASLAAGSRAHSDAAVSFSDAVQVSATTSAAGSQPLMGVSRAVDGGSLRVFGTLPAGSKPLNLAIAVRDPAQYAAAAFVNSLAFQGVKVLNADLPAHRASQDTASFAVESRLPLVLRPSGSPVATPHFTGRVVATRTSPPLSQIVTVINKVSQNLHAELLLRLLGSAQGDDGSIVQGVRVVRQFLVSAGIDPLDFTFVDGSGLSPQDLITPRATTTLLVYAARQSWGADYRASLPVGGVDGSLAGRFTQPPLRGRVFAKTGSLTEVSTLSGYLIAASGRTLAFSILSNDYVGEGSRATIDRVAAAIASAF